MSGFELSSVVDADLYLEYDEGGQEKIEPGEAIDYANRPLDEDVIREVSGLKSRSIMKGSAKRLSADARREMMKEDYFDHVTSFSYRMVLEDEGGEEYEFVGRPRTDLTDEDFNTLIFPNVITFQAVSDLEDYDPESNPHLVMREMAPYGEEIENMIVSNAEFTDERSYDREVSEGLRSSGHSWVREPDNFVYVDEPRDFLALNGRDGLYQEIENTEIPQISCSDWKILSAEDEELIGLRPFFHEIWDSGLSKDDAGMLGRWRGVNRGIGRWIYDMDDEFFYGIADGDQVIGFYDNEMPFAVGSDRSFETDIRSLHNQKVREGSGTDEFVENRLESIMKEEEETMARKVEEKGLDYMDFVPRKIDEGLIPEEMKVDELF